MFSNQQSTYKGIECCDLHSLKKQPTNNIHVCTQSVVIQPSFGIYFCISTPSIPNTRYNSLQVCMLSPLAATITVPPSLKVWSRNPNNRKSISKPSNSKSSTCRKNGSLTSRLPAMTGTLQGTSLFSPVVSKTVSIFEFRKTHRAVEKQSKTTRVITQPQSHSKRLCYSTKFYSARPVVYHSYKTV